MNAIDVIEFITSTLLFFAFTDSIFPFIMLNFYQ